MPCPLPAPTYAKEKEKDKSAHAATKKPMTTVATFIINCNSENSNDLHAKSRLGRCSGASSSTNVSSPRTSRFKRSAAAKASATPRAYIRNTNRALPPKKPPARVSHTGSFAEQEMYGRMRMTRRCTFLFSSPRVVRMAAALHPNPSSSENTARPVSPTRANSPSVMNARAESTPLSSSRKREKYSTASCGNSERSMPAQEQSERRRSAAAGLPCAAANAPSAPPSFCATAYSMPSFSSTAGIYLPKAK